MWQRLSEQNAGGALAALCPELSSDAALARLAGAGDDLVMLIEARVTAPEAVRESDAGFVRASWGAVPPGLMSPMRGTKASGASRAPPPESPAALAAQLSALADAGEWDVAETLIDNRAILMATFFSDVLLLARALASGVDGARRVAAALPPGPAAALLNSPVMAVAHAAERSADIARSPSASSFTLEPEAAATPVPSGDGDASNAPTPAPSEAAESDTDGESTPVPE